MDELMAALSSGVEDGALLLVGGALVVFALLLYFTAFFERDDRISPGRIVASAVVLVLAALSLAGAFGYG